MISQQARQAGLKVKLFSLADDVDSMQLVTIGGKDVEGYIFAPMVDLNTETKEITEFKKRSPSWPGSYKTFYGFIYFQSRISFTALMDLFRAAPMYRRNK